MEIEPILLARNLTLNSVAAPNYKYMFGPRRFPYLICETSQKVHFLMLRLISSTERKKSVTPIKIYEELLTFCAQVTICCAYL